MAITVWLASIVARLFASTNCRSAQQTIAEGTTPVSADDHSIEMVAAGRSPLQGI